MRHECTEEEEEESEDKKIVLREASISAKDDSGPSWKRQKMRHECTEEEEESVEDNPRIAELEAKLDVATDDLREQKWLLDKGYDPNNINLDLERSFPFSEDTEDSRCAQHELDAYERRHYAIHEAVSTSDLFMVTRLHKRGADLGLVDPHNMGETPMHGAFQASSVEIAQYLWENGCAEDVSKFDEEFEHSPMTSAVEAEDVEMLQWAFSRFPKTIHDVTRPDFDDDDPARHTKLMTYAFENNALKSAKVIFENGGSADINHINAEGDTPLHLAVQHPFNDVLPLLEWSRSAGARFQPNAEDGDTLMHTAARSWQVDTCKWLWRQGQRDIYIKTIAGHTPLHSAIRPSYFGNETSRQLDTIAWLMEMMANSSKTIHSSHPSLADVLQQADSLGRTPLMLALKGGSVRLLSHLFEALPPLQDNEPWPTDGEGQTLFSMSMPDRKPHRPMESSSLLQLLPSNHEAATAGAGVDEVIFSTSERLARACGLITAENRDEPSAACLWLVKQGVLKSTQSGRAHDSVVRAELSKHNTSSNMHSFLPDMRNDNERFHDRKRYLLAAIRRELKLTRTYLSTILLGTSRVVGNQSPLRRLCGFEGVLRHIANLVGVTHGAQFRNLDDTASVLRVYDEPETVTLSGFFDTADGRASGFNGEYRQVDGSAGGLLRTIGGRPSYVKDMPTTMQMAYAPDPSARIFHLFYRAATDDWMVCEKTLRKIEKLSHVTQQVQGISLRLMNAASYSIHAYKAHVLKKQYIQASDSVPDRSHPWNSCVRWHKEGNVKETLHRPTAYVGVPDPESDGESDDEESINSNSSGAEAESDGDHEHI